MSAVPSYLMSRNGVWYFNYRIPALIRKKYGITKQFIRKSLRTDNGYEAVKLSRKYTSLLMSSQSQGSGLMKISGQINGSDQERILMLTEGNRDIFDYAINIGNKIAEHHHTNGINRSYAEQTEFWKQYSEYEYKCYCLAVDRFNAQPQPKIKNPNIVVTATNESSNDEKSITLNELIEKFLEYKKADGAWRPRTTRLQEGRLYIIRDFLEYAIGVKNPMINLFTSIHAIKFEEEFFKYPKNRKQIFPEMSMKEIMSKLNSAEFNHIERISTNNYNQYAELLMTLFKWAKEDKKRKYLSGENVFVELKKTAKLHKSYSPFTDEEIKLFFGSDMYRKKEFNEKYSWRYWIPIIMLYHGMRLEEAAQLLTKNIILSNGVWCFDIRDEFDEQGRILTITKKRGKQTGERVVPIHRKMIGIGFLDYVQHQKKEGNVKLFPTLSNCDSKGRYIQAGRTVSVWFNEDDEKYYKNSYFTKVGINKKKNLVLYSFKHSAETLLINHPDNIADDKIDTMIGHLIKSTGRDGCTTASIMKKLFLRWWRRLTIQNRSYRGI